MARERLRPRAASAGLRGVRGEGVRVVGGAREALPQRDRDAVGVPERVEHLGLHCPERSVVGAPLEPGAHGVRGVAQRAACEVETREALERTRVARVDGEGLTQIADGTAGIAAARPGLPEQAQTSRAVAAAGGIGRLRVDTGGAEEMCERAARSVPGWRVVQSRRATGRRGGRSGEAEDVHGDAQRVVRCGARRAAVA